MTGVYTKYRAYKDAELELGELGLRLKTHWFKIGAKIALIKDVDHALEENLRIHFAELFELLSRKLEDAKLRLRTVENKQTRLKRVKFAVLVKTALKEATQMAISTRLDVVPHGPDHESDRRPTIHATADPHQRFCVCNYAVAGNHQRLTQRW